MNNEIKQKAFLAVGAVGVIGLVAAVYFLLSGRMIRNFDDCVDAGNEVMLTYPGQCRTEDGRIFVQEV